MDDTARGPKVLLALVALVVVALGLKWFARANAPNGDQSERALGSASAPHRSGSASEPGRSGRSTAKGGGPLIVQVAGLVRRPGVYRLPIGARTFQAIDAAGGPLGRGDPGALQLAARLTDGARVDVPPKARAVTATPSRGPGSPASSPAGPVSLTSATAEQLDSLDGIGPTLAKRIIEWRQAHGGFGSVADLDRVPGIGPAKYEAIKDSVVP